MKWLSKSSVFTILILEIILIGVLGYSQNVDATKNALILFGISIIFVGYLISFKLRGDLVDYFVSNNNDKTVLKVTGMIVFLVGVAVLALSFAI
ncbi:hypothetical protein [Companilactobacillus sp. DQM5]|uniref:hypothetical protein n=1 Tax=Companilactobacillus sp. DQM5 TaxID=3463359 RepID=UPI0040596671